MASSSSTPKFQVFISHAGEDKAMMAIPLRKMLHEKGITAFVDEEDMPPGVEAKPEMISAMETANVGLIILSPEFVAKEWPMKELLCFLKRREDAVSHGASYPVVIPLFYRLSVSESYEEPRLGRKGADGKSLYHASRFFERMNRGDPEADIQTIKNALGKLHGIIGVRNDVDATNGSEHVMSVRRELLLQKTCDTIVQALAKQNKAHQEENVHAQGDTFHRYFAPVVQLNAVLDFRSMDTHDNRMTPEARIKQQLLAQGNGSSRVFAIMGIGGVGKSTILMGLANDDNVRKEFRDGVHIISLGMDATTTTLFREVCKTFRAAGCVDFEHQLREGSDVSEAIGKAISWFLGKRCAFLIDDAWTRNIGFELLSSLCQLVGPEQQSTVIFTTREREVASLATREGVTCLHPREPHGEASRSILFCHAGTPGCSGQSVEESITEVLDVCDGLPVSLAAAGKGVKMLMIDMENQEENAWKEYLIHLRTCREQLIEEDVRDYGNLYSTFGASIALLDQQREEKLKFSTPLSFAKMHRRLCVLQKQDKVPASMLKNLWEMESVDHATVVGMRFVQVGLADSEYRDVDSEYVWHLRLHDSLHDFARAEAKRHEGVVQSHEILLAGYSRSDPELWCTEEKRTKWWSKQLGGDGYLHGNLCRHLIEAYQVEELIELLKTPEWIARQLEMNGVLRIEADFALGIETLSKTNETDDSEDKEVLRLIRGALNLSSGFVSRNAKELWFQLHGRLIGYRARCDAIDKYLDRMERVASDIWLRSLHPFLVGPDSWTTTSCPSRIIPVGRNVWCMAVIDSNELVACGYGDGRIAVVNLVQGLIEREWSAHDREIRAVAVGKYGKRVVTGSGDKTVKSWDVDTCHCLATFRGHTDHVNSVAIMKDGTRAVSGSSDGTVQIWDTMTGRVLVVFEAPLMERRPICYVALFPDERRIVSGEVRGKLRVWNLPSKSQAAGLYACVSLGLHGRLTCVAVTSDGQHVVSSSTCGTLNVWSIDTRSLTKYPISTREGPPDTISCGAVSGDGGRIVYGYVNGKVRVWDIKAERQTCQTLPGNTMVADVSVLLETDAVASCSVDGLVRMWDLSKSGEQDLGSPQEPINIYLLTVTPDGKYVLSVSQDHSIRIWNISSGRQQGATMRGHTKQINGVAVSPDGLRFVSVSDDLTLRVWDMELCTQLWEGQGHTKRILCVTLTPSGDRAVTGSCDLTIRLWQLTGPGKGNHITLNGHSERVERVIVSSDGRRIVSVGPTSQSSVNTEKTTPYYKSSWSTSLPLFDKPRLFVELLVWDLQTQRPTYKVDVSKYRYVRELPDQNIRLQRYTRSYNEDVVKYRFVRELPDRNIMELAGEVTEDADMPVRIYMANRKIRYGQGKNAAVIGTIEADVDCWAISPDHKKLCVGLANGNLAFLQVETPPNCMGD